MALGETVLRFSTDTLDLDSYRLLELPQELLKVIENADNAPINLVIKGGPADDAVLCTDTKTYSLRSVTLSNSLLVSTPPLHDEKFADASEAEVPLVVRQQLTQILEVLPSVPRLQRFDAMMQETRYDEGHEDEENTPTTEDDGPNLRKRRKITRDMAESVIQASDAELNNAIRDRHVVQLDGELRQLSPSYLLHILTLILNCIASHSINFNSANTQTILDELQSLHDVLPAVTSQVLEWYGSLDQANGTWAMDPVAVVKEIGLGILRPHRHDGVEQVELTRQWQQAIGDSFETYVDLDLLRGNYLEEVNPKGQTTLTYFPSKELSPDPATRFGDLFLMRARWRHEDIVAFLSEVAVDVKDRDRLLLKYARASTDQNGVVWYTAKISHI